MRYQALSFLAFSILSSSLPACGGRSDDPNGLDSDSGVLAPPAGDDAAANAPGATTPGTGVGSVPGTTATDDGGVPSGSGSFTVMSDRPIAGSTTAASYKREASFTTALPACTTSKVGACTINPCYVASSSGGGSVPNVGEISISGAEMTPAALQPSSNGSYSSAVVEGQVAWETGGEAVTVAWAHLPGDASQPGGQLTLASPPYVALPAGSAFAAPTSTLARDQDVTFDWTSDSAPSTADQLLIDLTSTSTQIVCEYSASAGVGVVPAAALQSLPAGAGTFDVHSKEYASLHLGSGSGAQWSVGFNVDAHARTSYGLSFGAVTFQ